MEMAHKKHFMTILGFCSSLYTGKLLDHSSFLLLVKGVFLFLFF